MVNYLCRKWYNDFKEKFNNLLIEGESHVAKLSISKKLARREDKPAPKLIAAIYKTLMVDIIGAKYNAKFNIIDDVNDCDGPCFVIFNHLSRIDHMYVCGATYPRVTNMIAGNNEFYRSKF